MRNTLQLSRRLPAIPRDMSTAPALPPPISRRTVERFAVLLINPFYAKDPRASFGKPVLTPTLSLTSLAGATPPQWQVRYWDENLLQGTPPCDPPPQVVGITVHLTFARRAYALAAWYRAQGAVVILGGLHVLSCPEEELEHGYAWCYDRLFSHGSIWKRRPRDHRAVLAYLAMSYLYERSNRFWHLLIKSRLTAAAWKPLIEHSRRRHLRLHARLERLDTDPHASTNACASQYLSPGV